MMQGSYRTRLSILLLLFAALPSVGLIWAGAHILGAAYLLLSLLVGPALARWITAPQEQLLAHLRRLNAGELRQRLLLTDDSAWMQVAAEVNALSDRLEKVTATLEQQVAQRTEALERKASQLRAVGEVGRQVAGVLETDHLLHFVASVVRGTFGYDAVAVLLRRGEVLTIAACTVRGKPEFVAGGQIPLAGGTPAARAVRAGRAELGGGRPLAIGQAAFSGDPSLATTHAGEGGASITPLVPALAAQSELAVPITLGDLTLGALVAQSRRPSAFADDDIFTLQTLAGQLAVALENGRLLAAERQLRDLAITEERNRMAREIHDTLAQGFMGILMQARAASQVIDQPADLQFHLDQIQTLASQNLQEARRSVWNLRPRPLEGRTLGEALAEEVAGAGQRAAMDARFSQEGAPVPLPASVEVVLLRCAQEALNNAIKHSGATELTVRLTYLPEEIELVVADNGRGFDPAALPPPAPGAGGFGLHAMADRVRTVGGTASIIAAPGQGTMVHIQMPLRREVRL
jgi:signal transduction histidine kinase